MKDGKKKKVKKKKVSRRAFAATSMAAASTPAIMGCDSSATTLVSNTEPVKATSSNLQMGGKPRSSWKAGTTIPAEYYIDPKHFDHDQEFLTNNLWLMVDHNSRIPEAGDYFTFEFGRGENIIILRGETGMVRAFHNVCRHRGSRLCRNADVTGAEETSILQLGPGGNTQVFRCPYHGWTYDLQGKLTKAHMKSPEFDLSENGLIPCHVRVAGGHIFVNLSKERVPPPFDGGGLRDYAKQFAMADLKVGARGSYTVKANWKLLIENFVECYHCGPSHENLVSTHNWDYRLTEEEKAFRTEQLKGWVGERPGGWWSYEGALNPGFVTGSLDGKPIAPLLPNRKEWTHASRDFSYGFSTAYWQGYDDYVVGARFTPRNEMQIDCEIFWLVHPDAVEGEDFDAENLKALWESTFREDILLCENQHLGIMSGGYKPGEYFSCEGNVAAIAQWYMTQVAQT